MEVSCFAEKPPPFYDVDDISNIVELSLFGGGFGWMDVCAVRRDLKERAEYSVSLLTGLEVLDEFPIVKLCVGYSTECGAVMDGYVPSKSSPTVYPMYITLRGWLSDTTTANTWDELPDLAKEFVKTVENYIGVPIRAVRIRDKVVDKC